MTTLPADHVDIYPDGLLADLRRAWRYLTVRRFPTAATVTWRWRRMTALRIMRGSVRLLARNVRGRQWRELRQYLNGYLAEPYHWPEDGSLSKCGRGWTKAGAMRSLRRRGWRY
jgi:hypothetical protein